MALIQSDENVTSKGFLLGSTFTSTLPLDTSDLDLSEIVVNSTINSLRNMTEEELLLSKLGPRRRDLPSVIFLLIIYSLIFVSGVVGNICTCIVIAKNHYMQTTTNYYLFSLAISDVSILLLGLPQEAYMIWEAYPWRFGEPFCIFKSVLAEMTSYASVLTITAFTVERYVAICHPLKSHKFADLRRSIKIILGIWLFSFLCALPYPIHTKLFYYLDYPGTNEPILDSLQCNIPRQWQDRMRYMFQVSTFIFFIFPMTVITVLYIMIAITLRKTTLNRAGSEESSKQSITHHHHHSTPHSMKVVLRMLVAVVVAFFVCWAPFHAQRLLTLYNSNWTHVLLEIQSHLFYISGVLYFVGSTVNPILYNVMSKRYRQAFKETLCCCFVHRSTTYQRTLMSHTGFSKTSKAPQVSRFRKTSPETRESDRDYSSIKNGHAMNGHIRQTNRQDSLDDALTVKLLQDQTNNDMSNYDQRHNLNRNGNTVVSCQACTDSKCQSRNHQFTMVKAGSPHQTELLEINSKRQHLYPINELKAVKRNGTCV